MLAAKASVPFKTSSLAFVNTAKFVLAPLASRALAPELHVVLQHELAREPPGARLAPLQVPHGRGDVLMMKAGRVATPWHTTQCTAAESQASTESRSASSSSHRLSGSGR